MTHFKLYWVKKGGHIHVRLFSAEYERMTHGKNGDLCFRKSEWESFLRCFQDKGTDTILVLPEEGETSP